VTTPTPTPDRRRAWLDPAQNRWPVGAKTVHLRETGEKKFDSPAYAELFQVMETVGGTQWYIVEEEAGNSFDFTRQAIEKLRKLGK